MAAEVTDELKVIYKGYSSSSGTLYVSVEDPVTGDTTQYECSTNAIITIGGEALNINKIKAGEYVTLGLAGDIVVEITSLTKTETIRDAKLASINPSGSIIISHEDEKYDGLAFELTENTRITKEELNIILDAGKYAPSAMNQQSSLMVVVDSDDIYQELCDLTEKYFPTRKPYFYGARDIIIVFGDSNCKCPIEDGTLVLQN